MKRPSGLLAAVLASCAVRKPCVSKVADPVSSSLWVANVGSVAAIVGGAVLGLAAGVPAERLYRAAVLASLKKPTHAVVVLGGMATNACYKPVCGLAVGDSPVAAQTHLSDILFTIYENGAG